MNLVYTVQDSASNTCLPPMTFQSERDAIHAFTDAANDPQTNISKYPADFTLLQIGHFDPRSGKIKPLDDHKIIGNAMKFKKQDS